MNAMPHVTPTRLTLFAALFAALVLGGCGKKGPLYLPDEPRPAKQDESR